MKLLANRLKSILLGVILEEQFGFLFNRQIHDAVGLAQEGMHTIKVDKIPAVILKIDLAKPYDKVNWLYLKIVIDSNRDEPSDNELDHGLPFFCFFCSIH